MFFFQDPATPELYTLSLHDALPILTPSPRQWETGCSSRRRSLPPRPCSSSASCRLASPRKASRPRDRKSTRLNSSHRCISYAVFCLKKKKDNVERNDPYDSHYSAWH